MRTKITNFVNTYIHISNNGGKRGMSHAKVMEFSLKQYKAEHGGDFNMLDAWRRCTSSQKWVPIQTPFLRPSKRLKTTSTLFGQTSSHGTSNSCCQLNLNDHDPEFIYYEPEELPVVREKANAAARGGGSSSRMISSMSFKVSSRFD